MLTTRVRPTAARRFLLPLAVIAALLFPALAACSSPEPLDATDAVIIDVRTPEEYAAGHLDGATNIDYYADDFSTQVDVLDKEATYILYCRSGVRAGDAAATMKDLGFTDVTSAGGMEDASKSTGIPII